MIPGINSFFAGEYLVYISQDLEAEDFWGMHDEAAGLVMNKADLLSTEERRSVTAWLQQQAPNSPVAECRFGTLPAAILLGQHGIGERQAYLHHGHPDYTTLPFQTFRALDRHRLEVQLNLWPAHVLRAKGFVNLHDDPENAYVLQLVGRRYSLERGHVWGSDQPETQLILIGASLEFDSLWLRQSLLSACL